MSLIKIGTVLCLVILLSVSCVTYKTGDLPLASLPIPYLDTTRKSHVTIEITCFSKGFNEISGGRDVNAEQSIRGLVAEVLDGNPVIGAYTFKTNDTSNADYRIALTLRSAEESSLVSLLLTGATFTILPTTSTSSYKLTAHVVDKNQQERGYYEVEDSMRTWIQLFLLPFGTSKSPDHVQKKLLSNMLQTILLRMNQDKLFQVAL